MAMARILRSSLPDGVFHVTSHGIENASIFRDDVDRLDFLHLLAIAAREFDWSIKAYCLMNTHYHLVLETSTANLSAGMHRLNGRYAQLFNERHRRRGHVFEGRFRSWVVRDEKHFDATCEYVLQNPVKAGACPTAAEWPWSQVVVVSEQDGESLVLAERGHVGRQIGRRVRDVAAEEEAVVVAPDEQRHVPGRVTGRRHEDQPTVSGEVERPRKRPQRRAGEVDEHGLAERPVLRDVPTHPP